MIQEKLEKGAKSRKFSTLKEKFVFKKNVSLTCSTNKLKILFGNLLGSHRKESHTFFAITSANL